MRAHSDFNLEVRRVERASSDLRELTAAQRAANSAAMTKHNGRNHQASAPPRETAPKGKSAIPAAFPVSWLLAGAITLLLVSLWAYWPTAVEMVGQWIRQPDYSHGFLVIPLSLFFLWSRRSQLAQIELSPSAWGAALLAIAASLRIAASWFFLGPLDGWTIPIWIAGIVWLLFGWQCLRWSLPAIVFLWFMVPMPFSAESLLSLPLQKVATKLSTACLVMLGQPAIAEGNVIWLGNEPLNIAEACSGLRILMGIYALAFAFVLFSRWSWWQKALVLVAALPIAIFANVVRIVVTGLLYQFSTSNAARVFMHDMSGLLMIPFAAAVLWLFLMYLDRLFPEVEEMSSLEAGRGKL